MSGVRFKKNWPRFCIFLFSIRIVLSDGLYWCKIWVILQTHVFLGPLQSVSFVHCISFPDQISVTFPKHPFDCSSCEVIIFNKKMPADSSSFGALLSGRRVTLNKAEGFYYHIVMEQTGPVSTEAYGPGRGSHSGEAS